MAAVTQTLLSTFGSKFVLPQRRGDDEQRHHVVRPHARRAQFVGGRASVA